MYKEKKFRNCVAFTNSGSWARHYVFEYWPEGRNVSHTAHESWYTCSYYSVNSSCSFSGTPQFRLQTLQNEYDSTASALHNGTKISILKIAQSSNNELKWILTARVAHCHFRHLFSQSHNSIQRCCLNDVSLKKLQSSSWGTIMSQIPDDKIALLHVFQTCSLLQTSISKNN